MLLGPSTTAAVSQDRSCAREALLTRTIENFSSCFPSITIRVLDYVSAVNAQASRSNGERIVDIFGGLAYHPALGVDALSFSLLHEIGHHLGEGARLTPGSRLACECAADRWVILDGLPTAARNNMDLDINHAMSQLERAIPTIQDANDASVSRNETCWCWDWVRRKYHLSSGDVPDVSTCLMFGPR